MKAIGRTSPNIAVEGVAVGEEMPKKSKLAVLLIAGIVVVVGLLVVLLLNPTRSVPVKVTLQAYTNECAAVTIENQTSVSFNYGAAIERKLEGKWSEYLGATAISADFQSGFLRPGQQTNLTISVSVYAPSRPWRITVSYRPPIPVKSMRFRAADWCAQHGLRYVSRQLLKGYNPIWISTPEMAQIDSVNKN